MKLLIYCAGGFGKEVFDTAVRVNRANRRWDAIDFVDDSEEIGNTSYGARVCSLEDALKGQNTDQLEFLIANGEPVIRELLYDKLIARQLRLATLYDTTSIVSDTAEVQNGVLITSYCSVSSSAVVGRNVAVNAKSIVGHDVIIGEHTVISSLVNIGGATRIGRNSYIGMGVSIREGTTIGDDVIVGMGSVVYNDIPDGVIALGNPARPMRKNSEKRVFKGTNR